MNKNMKDYNFEKIFKDIFEKMPEATVVYEPIDSGDNFLIKFFNRSAEKIEKVRASKVLNKKITKVFPLVKKFGILRVLSRVYKTGKAEIFPLGFYKDNRVAGWRDNYIFKLPSGEVVAVYTDETMNKQHEERLKENEVKLKNSEEQLSITLKSIGDAVIVTDSEGKITFLNIVAQKLTKWPEKEAIGQPLDKVFNIFNEKTGKKVEDPVAKVIQNGKIVGLGNHTKLISRDGKKIAIEDSAAPIKDDQGKVVGVVLVFHDVTEKREAQKNLEKTNDALKIISKCNEALIHINEEVELLNEICKIIVDIGRYRFAWIGYVENDKNKIVRPVAQAGLENGYLESAKITWADTKRGQGLTGTAIRTGKVVVCNNMLTDPKFAPWKAVAIKRGYASSISLPIFINSLVGAVNIYAAKTDAFSKDEVKLLSQLTKDLSYGIKNIRINKKKEGAEKKVKENAANLRRIMNAIPDGLDIVDENLNILWMNKTFLSIFGENSIGKKCYEIYKDDKKQCKFCPLKKPIKLGETRSLIVSGIAGGKDFEITHTGIIYQGKKAILEVFRDITEQKIVADKLKESEERYRNLISNLPKTEYVLVHRNGKLLWANDNVISFLGYSKEKIIGTSIFDYLEKKYQQIVLENMKKGMAGETVGDYEIKIKNKKGQMIDVVVRGSLINYMGEPAVLLILSDITEVNKRDEEILKKNKFLDSIIDLNPFPIQIYDKTGYTLRVNKAYMKMFRFTGTTPPLENYNWFEDPIAKKLGLHEYQQLIKKGQVLKFSEMPYNPHWVMPDLPDINLVFSATAFPIMSRENKLERFVLMFEDITEKRAIEEKIKANMAELVKKNIELDKFKLAVASASDLIVITNSDGVIIYTNKAMEKITGYSIEEAVGNRPSLWGGQMSKEFYKNLWKTISEDKAIFSGEVNNKRKNGEVYMAEVSISPILDSNGKIIFFVGIERDITKLRELDRAKSEFVSVASHQLKTPLSGIKWVLESTLKNRENNLNELQLKDLKGIYENNERMISLVNDLLGISRIDSGKYALINLNKVEIASLVERVIRSLNYLVADKKIKISFNNYLPSNYSLTIDEEKIQQVISNLVTNSIKYSKSDGGTFEASIEISAKLDDGWFVFSITDNGVGIPIQNQRHIFEKFYRAENAAISQATGSGLGLYIAKYFVEKHNGKIWFVSKEGVGTTFTFTLKADLV